MKEKIKLSDHFTYSSLLRFSFPSIIMVIFISIYSVVDGFFISNFSGETSFAAVNLILPYPMIFSALCYMLGTGSSAMISKLFGMGEKERGEELFSAIFVITTIVGILITILGWFTTRPVAILLGAEGELLEEAATYGKYFFLGMTFFLWQGAFMTLFVAAEKPNIGLLFTIFSGVTNMVFDALFIGVFGWGVFGAAIASGIGQLVGGVGSVIYFLVPNTSLLHLGKPVFRIKDILKSCTNGFAEFLSNVSMNIVNIAFNFQLLKFYGELGVSAYGIIMYVTLIYLGVYIGYATGIAPIVGYHFGAQNKEELKGVLKKSLVLISIFSIILFLLALLLSPVLGTIFAGYNGEFYDLSVHALKLYAITYLVCGFNVLLINFFAALNNGLVSSILSMCRVFLFQMITVFAIPAIFGPSGIWVSVAVAELFAGMLSFLFLLKNKQKYGYL